MRVPRKEKPFGSASQPLLVAKRPDFGQLLKEALPTTVAVARLPTTVVVARSSSMLNPKQSTVWFSFFLTSFSKNLVVERIWL